MGGWVDFDMYRYSPLLLFIGLASGQVDSPETEAAVKNQDSAEENYSFRKHNISIGMFDDRTGFSLIGYTYNVRETELDEYFIGGATMIMAFTGTEGVFFKPCNPNLKISTCFS